MKKFGIKDLFNSKKGKTSLSYNKENNKVSYLNDEDDAKIDNFIPAIYKDELEKRLEDIHTQIEMVGKVCDVKMAQSYEEYHNSIKSSKAQLWDDLTKLNFKLIEFKKQNTKEDFVNKLKSDLKNITEQVHQKDKELSANTKILTDLETKVSEMKEEKSFLSQEIKHSNYYNNYLKSKLKEIEDADSKDLYEEWIKTSEKNDKENNSNIKNKNTSLIPDLQSRNFIKNNKILKNINDTNNSNSGNNLNNNNYLGNSSFEEEDLEEDNIEKAEKLEYYIDKNLDIMNNKLYELEKKINNKYKNLSVLEKFNNPILQLLNEKAKAQIESLQVKKNNKLTSKEVFFKDSKYSTQKSISIKTAAELKDNINENNNSGCIDIGKEVLHRREKREIVKEFISDEVIKRMIYDILYKENSH